MSVSSMKPAKEIMLGNAGQEKELLILQRKVFFSADGYLNIKSSVWHIERGSQYV